MSLQDSAGIRFKAVYDVPPIKESDLFLPPLVVLLSPPVGHKLLSSKNLFLFFLTSRQTNPGLSTDSHT